MRPELLMGLLLAVVIVTIAVVDCVQDARNPVENHRAAERAQ